MLYKNSPGVGVGVNDTVEHAAVAGISFVTADEGGSVRYVGNGGIVRSDSALWMPGEFYFLSSEAGKMCTWDELEANEIVTCVGYALTTTTFLIDIVKTGLPKMVAPVNTVAPVVSGTVQVGETLSCTTGTWTGTAPTFTYQWQNDDGGGFANITGATSSTYVIHADYEGDDIRCVVTGTNAAGSDSENSNSVGPVLP